MVGYQGENGNNPLTAVSIETLMSALRLLTNRTGHEVAPYVSSWKAGTLGFSTTAIDRQQTSKLNETVRAVALGELSGARVHAGGLAGQIRAIAQTRPSSQAFRDAEAAVLRGIHAELSKIGDTAYLCPIADLARRQRGGLDVISLNYDLAIETMASGQGLPVDRGVDQWTPGLPLTFRQRSGAINLIKVHGSLDWSLDEGRDAGRWLARPRIQTAKYPRVNPRPWVVVGDREKLATSGPTLALMHAAELALQRADRLIVIGYSFGDAHINTMVRDWMNVDERRTLTAIDPNWVTPGPRGYPINEDIPIQEGLAIMAAQPQSTGPGRVTVIAKGAAEGLSEAISTAPERLPRGKVSVIACADGQQIDIRVTNLGVDMDDVQVMVFARKPHMHVLPLHRIDAGRADKVPNGLAVGGLLAGAHIDFAARDEWDMTTELEVYVNGRSVIDNHVRRSVICAFAPRDLDGPD